MLLAVCLFAPLPMRADQEKKSEAAPPAGGVVAPAQDRKAVLVDATRVSTEKAVKGASDSRPKEEPGQDSLEPSEQSAVTELRPAPQNEEAAKAKSKDQGANKKARDGPLKDVHGTVYGAAGSASQTTGGAVGASTKSGKTVVYIEGRREKTQAPRR